MKTYTYDEYCEQVAKDAKKLSEHFVSFSEEIKNKDFDKIKIRLKKIARLMNLNRHCEKDYVFTSLMDYMDLNIYKKLK